MGKKQKTRQLVKIPECSRALHFLSVFALVAKQVMELLGSSQSTFGDMVSELDLSAAMRPKAEYTLLAPLNSAFTGTVIFLFVFFCMCNCDLESERTCMTKDVGRVGWSCCFPRRGSDVHGSEVAQDHPGEPHLEKQSGARGAVQRAAAGDHRGETSEGLHLSHSVSTFSFSFFFWTFAQMLRLCPAKNTPSPSQTSTCQLVKGSLLLTFVDSCDRLCASRTRVWSEAARKEAMGPFTSWGPCWNRQRRQCMRSWWKTAASSEFKPLFIEDGIKIADKQENPHNFFVYLFI